MTACFGLFVLAVPAAAQLSVTERGSRHRGQAVRALPFHRTNRGKPDEPGPAIRDLSKHYPIDNLAEAFAEGIVTGHPAMPRFTFEPREINALLAFIESLTVRAGPQAITCPPTPAPQAALRGGASGVSQPAPVRSTERQDEAKRDHGHNQAGAHEVPGLERLGAVGDHVLRRIDHQDEPETRPRTAAASSCRRC